MSPPVDDIPYGNTQQTIHGLLWRRTISAVRAAASPDPSPLVTGLLLHNMPFRTSHEDSAADTPVFLRSTFLRRAAPIAKAEIAESTPNTKLRNIKLER